MREKIVANNGTQLKLLIEEEIKLNSNNCDLNHIDVSDITDMSRLFLMSSFNGKISNWDVTAVSNMRDMFYESVFNGDISQWNVSNVKDMMRMFKNSQFQGDLSNWTPYVLEDSAHMFSDCSVPIPYWAKISDQDKEKRVTAINNNILGKKLNADLPINDSQLRKPKL